VRRIVTVWEPASSLFRPDYATCRLFIEPSYGGPLQPDNLLDALLPLDQRVPAVALVEGADDDVRLGCHEGLTPSDGLVIARAGQGQDIPKSVDLAEPDGVRDIGAYGSDQSVGVTIKHRLAGYAGLEVLQKGGFQAGEALLEGRRTGFPVGQDGIVCRADRKPEHNLRSVRSQILTQALHAREAWFRDDEEVVTCNQHATEDCETRANVLLGDVMGRWKHDSALAFGIATVEIMLT